MLEPYYNCLLTNRNKMLKELSEQALSKVTSFCSSSQTSLDSNLFQYLSYSLSISQFVCDVINEQCEQVVEQLQWHREYTSKDFSIYLSSNITQSLLKDRTKLVQGELFEIKDYRLEYQSEVAIMKFLRNIRRQHAAAIAILELNEAISVEESAERMSILAELLTQAAYFWSYASQRETFGLPRNTPASDEFSDISAIEEHNKTQNMLILAMGKFGGFELNFSSDIDLIFFYLSEGQTQGGRRSVENSRFFQKVGILVIKLLDEITQDGFVFRVDMRLRPYGDSGNLVMSIAQAEDYYQEQGRGWERFAMVRARIITGRETEKSQLDEIITPFAFRRYIDYGVIDSLRNMKDMIQREVRQRGLKDNIKLGAGGIREIEFMVQSLQLIQGGRDKRLQEKSLLKVLPLLAEEKLLSLDTSIELAENYRFLRRLEHCLQELDEKQTQELPVDGDVRDIIASLMGFVDWQAFYEKLTSLQLNTNQHFNALFGEERTSSELQNDDFYLSLWEGHISAEELINKLPNLNQILVKEVTQILEKFRDSSQLVNLSAKGAKRFKIFFPEMLAICLTLEQPSVTLVRLLTILKAILKRTAYLELLSENLPLLRHLVDLVSRSDWIVQRLSESPILFDELLYPNSLYEPLQTGDLKSELQQSLLRIDENDEEQILDTIRRFKQTNELRVAAALLSERLSISQVSRYLTQLAQVIIQSAINFCWHAMVNRYGHPEGKSIAEKQTGFSVIGYGKLGGFELGFNSDLDLVFLFDAPLDSQTNGKKSIGINRFYTRLAQKLIHFLSTRTSLGVLYEVDMRLRPSGNSGLLVSHIDAFFEYQKESAWTWEHQALVRTRAIAGDRELCKKFEQVRNSILSSSRDFKKLKNDVLDMRNKMRKELDKTSTDKVDLKQCQGGLVDIEFLAQYFILKCASGQMLSVDSSPSSNTVDALKYARSAELVSWEDSSVLIETYRKYRNCLNEMVIVSGDKLVDANLFVAERKKVEIIWNKVFMD